MCFRSGWVPVELPRMSTLPGRAPAVARDLLRAVTNDVAAVPNNGLDYGLLRYHRRDPN
jgi:hypothetical protein